jgi:hypothetical protein
MKLSRLSRLVATFITIFSLLCTQFAVASYVCPGAKLGGTAMSAMPRASDVRMVGCPGVDKANPNMCHSHCKMGHQSPDTPEMPQVSPFVAAQLSFVLPDMRISAASLAPQALAAPLQRATAPPIAIRNCCFRI